MPEFTNTDLIYDNPLADQTGVSSFVLEGDASVTFPKERMRMENLRDPSEDQKANFVFWCREIFPDNIAIEWDFWQVREPGLCILFFSADGQNGKDLFDPTLAARSGEYRQYHSSDINALHVSYFRRKHPKERAFETCNLRKSAGFHMVCQGADPLPSVVDALPPYHLRLVKSGPVVQFQINQLTIFTWEDDGQTYGPILSGGKIGFRQMAPLIGEYANLKVHRVERAE